MARKSTLSFGKPWRVIEFFAAQVKIVQMSSRNTSGTSHGEYGSAEPQPSWFGLQRNMGSNAFVKGQDIMLCLHRRRHIHLDVMQELTGTGH
jgi:hypothetical protein